MKSWKPCAGLATLALAASFATAWAQEPRVDAAALEGFRARAIGPAAMSGRICAIDGFVGDRLTLFVGSAGGGLWKSRDGGVVFKPVFDKYNQSIGAVAVAPGDTNTVWVGTGEPWVRNSVSVGDGVYRSVDGGENWEKMGLEASERISRIAIHPRDRQVVFVGALGPLWSDGGERGVFRTRDGGKSWEHVLAGDASTGCADLAIDPANPDIVYASMWTFRRRPWAFSSGGPAGGLYRSTDGGSTWKKLAGGLPQGAVGRIAVAVAPSKPGRIYAVVETANTALWRSEDRGETWVSMNSGAAVGVRPFYFCSITVDPKNPDRVYKQGLNLYVSDDGGRTFSGTGGYHGDTHAIWIRPDDSNVLVLGTDGGAYISQDRGTNWRLVGTLPVSQFYHVSADMERPYNVYGGLQDNGSWTAPNTLPGGVGNRHWNNTGGGDGFWSFPDPSNSDMVFCEYQGGNVLRFLKSTRETKSIMPLRRKDEPDYRWNWNTPIHLSPTRAGTMYVGAQFLFRSTDRGENWTRISPDLTTNDPAKLKQQESGGVSVDNSSAENHCTIYSISESPKDPQVIWVGTDDGNVQLTRDGGKTWGSVGKGIPGVKAGSCVSTVRAGLADPASAYVTVDGHGLGDFAPHIFRSTDWGRTWAPLATPDLRGYAHVIAEDPVNSRLLFVGTEFGLFVSLDAGASWAQLKGNLPNVAVRDLAIHPREHDLLVATHGRGVYIFDDLTALRSLTPAVLAQDASFLPGRLAQILIPATEQRFDGDDQFVGEDLGESAWITYWLKKRHVFGDLKIEIRDAQGVLVTTLPGGKRRGFNRVEWSMRLSPPRIPPATNLVPQQYSFVGPRVPAGTYTATLIRGEEKLSNPLPIVPDARAAYTVDDRALQHETAMTLYHALSDLTFLVDAVTTARDQARDRGKSLAPRDPLARRLTAYADSLDAQRKILIATREGGRFTGEEQLREKLVFLYGSVNGYDGRPTGSQVDNSAVLRAQLEDATRAFETLTARETPALNAALQKSGQTAIRLLVRDEWEKSRP